MKRKCLAVVIILLFTGTCIIPAIAQDIEKTSQPTSSGNWLYVGGSGPGNYTRIQDAIDNASTGDTIHVYSGIYNENILIEKTLTLEGENKDTTIINGGKNTSTISIFNDNVQIMGFTITNSSWNWGAGVTINANHCKITNNVILDCDCFIRLQSAYENTIENNNIIRQAQAWLKYGIKLEHSENNHIIKNNITNIAYSMQLEESNGNTISNNIFTRNQGSIWLIKSHNNSLTENTITLTDDNFCFWIQESNNNLIMKNYVYDNEGIGIWILDSQGNRIQENQINNNLYGMSIEGSIFTLVKHNEITNNTNYGIYLKTAYVNLITKNNIFDNGQNALFRNAWLNHWWRNYWKPHFLGPKIIKGTIFKVVRHGYGFEEVDILTLYKCDWHPSHNPYDIAEMS